MEKYDKTLLRAFIVTVILLIVSLGFNLYYNVTDRDIKKVDTITNVVEKIVTIHDTVPKLVFEKQIHVKKDTFNAVELIHDTIENKVIVEVPITQKTYTDDSTYTAYVSGYRQKLDSINVYQKTISIDRTVTITKKDNHNFGIGPVIYGGYDVNNKNFGYGIGIGITWTILKF